MDDAQHRLPDPVPVHLPRGSSDRQEWEAMSVIMREAMDRWNEMRDDFEMFRHAQYERAAADCKGELLNALGREEGVDPYSLFLGTSTRAAKYASEELRDWWTQDGNSRMTVEAFERQWLTAREDPSTGPMWIGWPR